VSIDIDWISEWTPACDSLAQFLVTFVLAESVFGSQVLRSADSVLGSAAQSGCRVVPVWLDGPYAGYKRSIHLVNGEILVLDDRFIAAQDAQALETFPVEIQTLGEAVKSKEPVWADTSLRSGWYAHIGLVEDLAKRHRRQAEAYEKLVRQHRRWEKYFKDLAQKRQSQPPK
jgi:hypothetical protein